MNDSGGKKIWVLSAAALNIFVLYAPQPLLPLFGDLYGVSEPAAGLIMTAAMLPLALAPLSYGFMLGRIPPLRMLRLSLVLLAFLTALTGLVQTLPQLLCVRFFQGLIIPAALTSVMAFLAQSGTGGRDIQRSMSLYVSATIAGGFLGRLLAGLSSAFLSWQLFFYLLGLLLLCCFLLVGNHQVVGEKGRPPGPMGLRASLRAVKPCVPVYLAIFILFFVFCATLTYLPFRVVDLIESRSGILTGIMYCGYITGIATAMGAGRCIRAFGSKAVVMTGGYILFTATLLAMLLPDIRLLFLLLFPFCGAMFLVHSVATAVVNCRVQENPGLVSALYVTSYYSGGVLGSYLPGFLYKGAGWGSMVMTLAGFSLAGIVLVFISFQRGR